MKLEETSPYYRQKPVPAQMGPVMTEESWFEERWRRSWQFRFWYRYHTVKEWAFDIADKVRR